MLWGKILGAVVVGFIILFGLTFLPNKLRKPLIVLVTFLGGLFYAVEFFWPAGADDKNFLSDYNKPISDMATVLQAFALGLGVYSLAGVHLKSIVRQRAGWGNSLALLLGIVVMAVAHIGKSVQKEGVFKTIDAFAYDGIMKSLDATMFSIIAFYIVSAAYRAFRIRSVEATIMLVAAAIVMLGNVTIGQALTNAIPNDSVLGNLRTENLGQWLLKKLSSPATLAIDFGLGVGALATALRMWLSLEKGSYFEEEL